MKSPPPAAYLGRITPQGVGPASAAVDMLVGLSLRDMEGPVRDIKDSLMWGPGGDDAVVTLEDMADALQVGRRGSTATEPLTSEGGLDRARILAPLETVFLPDHILNNAALSLGLAELLEGVSPIGSGCILNGLPGTGKTELLRAVAHVYRNAGAFARECHLAEMAEKYVASLAHNLEEVFQNAAAQIKKHKRPFFLYFDEATTLVCRSTDASGIRDYYQGAIDVMKKYIGNYPGLVVGISTNGQKEDFDEALIREGRLDVIRVEMPDREQRSRMWRHFLNLHAEVQIAVDQADRLAEGWVDATGAAIVKFCRELRRTLIIEELRRRGSRNLIEALRKGPLLKDADIQHLVTFEQIEEKLGAFIAERRMDEMKPKRGLGFLS